MTAPVAIALTPDVDALTVGVTPFKLEIAGQPEPFVKVEKIQDLKTGDYSVRITALGNAGKPARALSTLDTIARRIIDGARVTVAGKSKAGTVIRHYA